MESNDRLPILRGKTLALPDLPGVYIMKDKSGKIIYIGKAKVLKNRVSQYFRNVEKHLEKVYQMVMHVYDFDYIITDSEFEALVLECSLIKLHSPKYNILLKDDKGYHYIRIAPKRFARIAAAKQRLDEEDAQYIGPYVSSYMVREAVDEVNEVFRLPTCSRKFPQDFRKGRPCLNYHIKRCMGVCRGNISERDYNEILAQARDFLKGGSKRILNELNQKMEQAAESLDFERAAQLRDRINALKKLSERQKVTMSAFEEQDVIAFSLSGKRACTAVLQFRDSRLVDKEDFLLEYEGDMAALRREFIMRYYSIRDTAPKHVAVDGEIEDHELLTRFLTGQKKQKVYLYIPIRGEQRQLILMAQKNAADRLSKETGSTGREVAALDELTKLLGLPSTPRRIEAYDISNLGSSNMVAGMVVFEGARPLKSAYKRFSIKSIETQDDYAAMREVLTRRLNRYREEKDTASSFAILPDLILLDGGKGHVGVIKPLIEQMGFSIPVFGMVKDDRHRTRAIAADGGEISISSYRSAFSLVSAIQEEVHRFSIAYQRQKRKGAMFSSSLTRIEGVGDAKSAALMKHFKTVRAIREASIEQLCEVKGVNRALAERIRDALAE